MKTYTVIIEPHGFFGTPLKGDTLFGSFCWQTTYDEKLLFIKFKDAIAVYDKKPFAVFSSAFPVLKDDTGYAFKRPDVPSDCLFNPAGKDISQSILDRKEDEKKKWWLLNPGEKCANMRSGNYVSSKELANRVVPEVSESGSGQCPLVVDVASTGVRYHNTINRLIGSTGTGEFAPFGISQYCYPPGTRLVIFVGIDEKMTGIGEVRKGLENIGKAGFGRDASTGMGKYQVVVCKEILLPSLGQADPNALYTLAPCVPETGEFKESYFSPFTRFGRHGDALATSGNPFKNPVIMADEGAVLIPKDICAALQKPYVGRGIGSVSLAEENTVAQGYSLYIPVRLEVGNE